MLPWNYNNIQLFNENEREWLNKHNYDMSVDNTAQYIIVTS